MFTLLFSSGANLTIDKFFSSECENRKKSTISVQCSTFDVRDGRRVCWSHKHTIHKSNCKLEASSMLTKYVRISCMACALQKTKKLFAPWLYNNSINYIFYFCFSLDVVTAPAFNSFSKKPIIYWIVMTETQLKIEKFSNDRFPFTYSVHSKTP